MLILAAVSLAFWLMATACGPKHIRPDERTPPTAFLTQHWIYEQNLRVAMRIIEQTTLGAASIPVSEPADSAASELRHQFAAAAELAAKLAQSADALPHTVAGINLGVADRRAFIEQSQALAVEAMRLGQAARKRSTKEMRRSLDAITTTCVSCHTRFRDFTPELAPPRA
jgi:cytochrome c556